MLKQDMGHDDGVSGL